MQIACSRRPLKEMEPCGDDGAWWWDGARLTLTLADGLGHGPGAARAAGAAMDYLEGQRHQPLAELFAGCDRALRDTRGVALGVAVIEGEQLTYAGVGNIRLALADGRRLHSDPGIVGAGYRQLLVQRVPFPPGSWLALSSDGLEEIMDLSRYRPRPQAQELADRLLADWAHGRDDAGVLVCLT